MGRSKQVFVSSPVYSVVPLFLRLFIDKSGHRWLGLQRADPAIGDSSFPLDLPSTPVMTDP